MPTITPPVDTYGPPGTSYGVPEKTYGAPTYGPPDAETPAPIIHRHVYVHVPPPEPEYSEPRPTNEVLPVQRHYRIIFIKAPSQPAPTPPVIPNLQENEEKTIVYVLVKKPEDVPEIVFPTPASTVPTKPEVYFIRYKAEASKAPPNDIESDGYYKK